MIFLVRHNQAASLSVPLNRYHLPPPPPGLNNHSVVYKVIRNSFFRLNAAFSAGI